MNKSPKDVLKKSYLKEKPVEKEIDEFIKAIEDLKNEIHENESEEYNKNLLPTFFQSIGYRDYKINTKGRIDLAIYNKESIPEVIIEAKAPKNRSEMISHDNFNKKAFHEALLYFLQEINKEHNYDIRHVIITNMYEWYVFDAAEFNKIASNKKIKKFYIDTEIKKRSLFQLNHDKYETFRQILESEKVLQNLDYVRFNLKDDFNKTYIKNLYKFLSPRHLLKQYIESDSNTLNTKFYDELLYILGLEETSGNKKLIQRISPSKRSYGSLIENTIRKLETETECRGKENEEELFEIALGLNITWLNRILFLKLLEAKLLTIHNGKYPKFLSFEIVREFDNLNTLFFEVLAIDITERKAIYIDAFKEIPYLNSVLFETTKQECDYLRISNLKDNAKIKVLSKSVLTQHRNEELNTLEYLLKFLSAYDFATDSSAEFKNEHTLINASVLGLIFEKLNGYKDGSFYTPSFITMYMTRQTIRNAVVSKFNEALKDDHIVFESFSELKNYSEANFYKEDFKKRANQILDSITIVDPAVGSGHFLVSALNELLVVKSELKVLRGLAAYNVTNENDELYIENKEGVFFEYRFGASGKIDKEAQEVQKALFHEKQKIIENQLFGVDINPNSAQITRLRLWIELLKHSYYDDNGMFVTMPNIDINIKAGNSLISRYSLHDEIDIPNIQYDIERYKSIVKEYKEGIFSVTKDEIRSVIDDLKEKFKLSLKAEWKEIKKQKELLKEYVSEYGFHNLSDDLSLLAVKEGYRPQGTLFGDDDETITKAKAKKREKLLKKLIDITHQIDEKLNGKIYENAFEWRFEFPEVLDDEGNFVGFDVVIGNPPYIMEDDNKSAFNGLHEVPCYQGKTDIWHLFTCKAIEIAKQDGYISFIAKNQWLDSASASNMRRVLYDHTSIEKIIDFGTNMVFKDAAQQTMIFVLKKSSEGKEHHIDYVKYADKVSLEEITEHLHDMEPSEFVKMGQKILPREYDEKENIGFSSPEAEAILYKIEKRKNFIFDEKEEMIQGIIGGPDKAFIIPKEALNSFEEKEKIYFKMLHTHTDRYYTEDTDKYICYIAKHNFKDKDIEDYPNINNMLLPYKSYIDEKGKEKGLAHRREVLKGSIEWYHLWWARDESFFKEGAKLIFASRTLGKNFTYTDKVFYGSRNLFFIKSNRVDLKYIVALLNSSLMYFYMQERLKHTGDLLQIDKNQFMKIPLYVPENSEKFGQVVDKIIDIKKQNQDTTELEAQIDQMVYELYGLNEEEIAIVEGREFEPEDEMGYNSTMENAE